MQASRNLPIESLEEEMTLLANYRTWPIYAVAFIRLLFVAIFERAFQNFLYFEMNITESVLGVISSAGALAYIVGPLFGQLATSKIGNKRAIVISSIAAPILMSLQMIIFEPVVLIIIRILSGLFLGLFWPNILNILSSWQNVSSEEKSKTNFKNFNMSWNAGFLTGILVGFLWAFAWDDYMGMVLSLIVSLSLLPISLFITSDKPEETKSKTQLFSESKVEKANANGNNTHMIIFPILFSWIGITYLAISQSLFVFSFPVFLKSTDNPSYYAYLLQFGIQVTQLTGIILINYFKVHIKKFVVFVSLIEIAIIAILVVLVGKIVFFIGVIFVIAGLGLGLIQGTSMKIMIDYGTAKNSTKYATINEIMIGTGFAITPIVAGFVIEVDIFILFMFLASFSLVLVVIMVFLSRNVKPIEEN